MIFLSSKIKQIIQQMAAYLLIFLVILLLMVSLGLKLDSLGTLRISGWTVIQDLISTFFRVTIISLVAWLLGISCGWFLHHLQILRMVTLPVINFLRHISPFAWLPFAIIWFGLGEQPVAFILLITLFFPALIAIREMYADVPKEYLDEARVCGAKGWQLFYHIEIPLITVSLLNFYRILWGLGWTVVIAAEMLGTATGLGFRLLDFRYLLFYEEMILYLIIMGISGILVDKALFSLVESLRKKNPQ